ncbi:MAG: hypothetical protein HON10_05480 [Euryarchaeota archaeon]|nr:hypothetical protein [Euryarchaeota archaeon]
MLPIDSQGFDSQGFYSFFDLLRADLIFLAIPTRRIRYVRVKKTHLNMLIPDPTETSF